MKAIQIQESINVYSMIRFTDGHREPGLIINKYNIEEGRIDYFFIQHNFMNEYKKASEKRDIVTCEHLAIPIDVDEIVHITPINLNDYKEILQLHSEYKQPPGQITG